MTRNFIAALVATTALSTAMPAFAQNAPQADDAAASSDGDIIVTARRADERLQDVPVSVQAISGDTLQKLAITSADDISKLAPGLTLVNAGASTQIVLRGVAWQPGSGTAATPLYFNEAGFDPGNTVVSLFDIGQIEVLRGPQGTSRGAPSISGAITVTTKKPNLTEFGGFAQGFYASANHWDVQAGVNVPIVKDVLAVRLATNIENSENDRVYSINSTVKPKLNDRSFRATVLLKPTDTLSIQAMYQRRRTEKLRYDQVVGSGSPGAAASALAPLGGLGAIRANFNGPALTLDQRASVEDGPNIVNEKVDLLTVNATWEVFEQKLSVNYGRQWNKGFNFNARDTLNMLPGYEPYASVPASVGAKYRTIEVRLSGDRVGGSPVSYDIGWYSKHSSGGAAQNFDQYLTGAFGAPSALPGAVTKPNLTYSLPVALSFPIGQVFDSLYGNLKFHIGENTELSGGVAFIRDRVPVSSFGVIGGPARIVQAPYLAILQSVPVAFRPFTPTCETINAALISSTNYPGVCEANVPAGSGQPAPFVTNPVYKKTLYNFAISHKFNDSVMAYATTGSSYRSGLPALGSVGLSNDLLLPQPETAKSYELGLKTTWGRNLHVNAAVFQIDYKGQLTSFENVTYWNQVENKASLTSLAFYRNLNSRVRGFELEVAARPTNNLTLNANMSYSQIKSKGGQVPANPGSCAGTSAVSAINLINLCPSPSGQVLNQDAPFQATINGSYTQPIGSLDAYFRFNLAYKGNNPNFNNFPTAGVFKPVPAYAILDLFAGVTGQDNVWELGFFAKNVTNKQVELSRSTPVNTIYGPYAVAPAGYDKVRVSNPREFGVSLRYAFGSR